MLKTLDNYVNYEDAPDWLLEPFWRRLTHNRRFRKSLAASVVGHLLAISLLIRLDMVRTIEAVPPRRSQTELVQIAELAAPDRTTRLRSAPEAIERTDPTNLRYDPKTANDTNLTARSPNPTTARGVPHASASRSLPSAIQIEEQARRHQGGAAGSGAPPDRQTRPPETTQVTATRAPQPDPTIASSGIPTVTTPPPLPPPQPKPSTGAAPANPQPSGQRGGDANQTTTLGFQAAEAQYLAYVRARIRNANERIMPRKWIEDVLANKVSADFAVILRRSGQIASARLVKSSGYALLDDVARQAIYMANPFEGYPQDAGDTITLTVTVYYTPGR